MPYRPFSEQNCSIASALAVVGERWSLLVMRDVLLGRRRFAEIKRSLGVAPNILSDRLAQLVEHGLLERTPISEGSDSYEYVPTAKGRDIIPGAHDVAGVGRQARRAGRPAARPGARGVRPRRAPPAALQPLRRGHRARPAREQARPRRDGGAARRGRAAEVLTTAGATRRSPCPASGFAPMPVPRGGVTIRAAHAEAIGEGTPCTVARCSS